MFRIKLEQILTGLSSCWNLTGYTHHRHAYTTRAGITRRSSKQTQKMRLVFQTWALRAPTLTGWFTGSGGPVTEQTGTLTHGNYYSRGGSHQTAPGPAAFNWSEMFMKAEWSFPWVCTRLGVLLHHNNLKRTWQWPPLRPWTSHLHPTG